MTVQDNVQSLISQLEQILWQDKLKEHPEVLVLLERIRHYLLRSQSIIENNDHGYAEKLSEIILNQVDHKISDRILQKEVQQLQDQKNVLLQDIATLKQQKQAILSNFFQDFPTDKELSTPADNNVDSNVLTNSVDTHFKPLLEELDSYSDSLQEGIERMYRLGQQSETKFLAYLNRLQEKVELFLYEEKINKITMLSEDWYLGFDITNNQVNGYLFTFKNKETSSENIKYYDLSQLIELWESSIFDHQNILDNLKEKLTTLNHGFNNLSLKTDDNVPLKSILEKIKAIALICPSRWNERDRNLLSNVILDSLNIKQKKEITWIPKPIALTLSYFPQNLAAQPSLSCVINLTETITEISIIDLSQGISGIISKQLFYGTEAIDQDILCHLIYPQWYEKITTTFPSFPQPLPIPGIAEISKRKILKQYLEKSNLGSALMESSQLTRLILQEQDQFFSTIAQKSWSVNRKMMIEKIINPWIKTIEQRLKALLSQGKYSTSSITHIILAGEAIDSLHYVINPWLSQIFTNVKAIETEKQVKDGKILTGLDILLNNND